MQENVSCMRHRMQENAFCMRHSVKIKTSVTSGDFFGENTTKPGTRKKVLRR